MVNILDRIKMKDKEELKKHKSLEYIIFYLLPFTLAFLFLQYIIFYAFKSSGKSFIWEIDGINQHFPSLSYYSQFLKDILKGKGLKMVDFKVGMGFDVLTTLNYYAIGDPISLLTVFGKPENMEGLYRFLIILRIFLAGMSFTIYCYYMEKKAFPSVLGGLIYCFCDYAIYAGVRHPYFTNPMIYLPLLFLGLEKVLRKKKPYVFILMVFVSAISNFYFFYMLTVMVFFYAVIRFFFTYKREGDSKSIWLNFFQTALRAGLYYTLGIMLSAFIFLPVVIAFLNNGRFDSGYYMNLYHYTKSYYVLMAQAFLAPKVYPGSWTHLVYAAIVPLSIVMLFKNKKYRELLISFIITTGFLMIPAVGYIMNGMAYVSNRWEFGYSFLIAFIFVATYEDLFDLKLVDKVLIILGTILYLFIAIKKPSKYVWIAFIFLLLSIVIVLLFNYYKKKPILQKAIIFLIVFTNIGANGFLTLDARFGNYVGEFIDSGKVQETIENSAVSLIPEIKDDSFYRIETFGDKQHNEALTVGYNDVAGYFSIMDKSVTEYMKGLELLNQRTAYRFDDMDFRTTLGALTGVKYLVTRDKYVAPYAYEVIDEVANDDKTYYLMENKYALPLGYTYSKFIIREDYERLSALEKQQIMLEAVVLEEKRDDNLQVVIDSTKNNGVDLNSSLFAKEADITFEPEEGIILDGETLQVTKTGAKLRINFTGVEKAETYLRLGDFNIDNTKYYTMDFKVKGEKDCTKTVNVRSKKYNNYFGKDDYLINLGYRSGAMNYCEITFNNKGKFHVGDIKVYILPMDYHINQLKTLNEVTLENIEVKNNSVTGTVDSIDNRLLYLSIPYSKGWKAYVNGEKKELLKANVMFMAVPLEAGHSEVKLIYSTYFLKEGIMISLAGCGILLGIVVYYNRRRTTTMKLKG